MWVWSWLRMNASSMLNTCKFNGVFRSVRVSRRRILPSSLVQNFLRKLKCLIDWKVTLNLFIVSAWRWICWRLGCWLFKRLPSPRSLVGLRGRPTTLELKQGPGWQCRPAVRNIGQWTKVWSSNTKWMMTAYLSCKVLSLKKIMTLFIWNKSWLILVPAAAVIREGQALSAMTGRKGSVGCKTSYLLKFKT